MQNPIWVEDQAKVVDQDWRFERTNMRCREKQRPE
jgi:hypothetical protein